MFNSSYQHVSFRQQIISTSQSYPCPRCAGGMLEAYGLTETLKCTSCERSFVALRGGRLLYPANRLGLKVALTFWWDGLRWHWAGHTASTKQLLSVMMFFFLPIMAAQVAFALNLIPERPDWLSPAMASTAIALLSTTAIYFMCWDFTSVARRKRAKERSPLSDRPASN
jgi:putative effector of murein hydrolase LrgA (UPF0299 family)